MTEDELLDLLTEIDVSRTLDKAAEFERAAARVPAGEHGRAALLIAAGQHHQLNEEYDEARRCFLEARTDGGESSTDPESNLLTLALDEGDTEVAAQQLGTLKAMVRRDEMSASACHFVGESLEEHDQLREAQRWFTMPLLWGDIDDFLEELCLVARFRVRRTLGLPEDRLDQEARELKAWERDDL